MDNRTERLLEFEKIRAECLEYCFSEEGRQLLGSQEILTDPVTIKAAKERTRAFRQALESGQEFPALSFPPVAQYLPVIAKQGAVLEGAELAAIGFYIRGARKLARFLEHAEADPVIRDDAERMPELEPLARELFRYLDPEGNLKEKEIPELRAIRERMRNLHGEIGSLAQGYLQNGSMQSYWQSTTPTIREGRTVLPMKANFRGRVKGIVHEVSSSGQTVFIEPFEIVERNNELIEQDSRYRREVLRILRELTSRAGARVNELETLIGIVAGLDATCARARYALLHDCVEARETERGLYLSGARHPLLGRKVVPIDIRVEPEVRVVIITGPNTGGKTVSLKTVGLLAMMNQFGLQIPAREGSALPYLDAVLADIGDEQSIEQSLSTFSGHMKNISGILGESTAGSLVLLDELGSGTDPEEGAALAMSLLDAFIERGCLTFVTTHHGILKNYGYTRSGVQNASVEFDSKSLSPTYRIVVGIPGESHAVEIAQRNGVPAEIIARALGYLSDERTDVGKLIKSLSEKQRELYEKEKTHEEREHELRELRRRTDLTALKLKQREYELRNHGVSDLSRFLDESRRTLENLVKELREGELTQEKTRRVKRYIAELAGTVDQERNKLDELEREIRPEPEVEHEPSALAPGVDVLVGRNRRPGTIVRPAGSGKWIVSTGSLRITVPERDLYVARGGKKPEPTVEFAVSEVAADNAPQFQLDVRGMRLEEAIAVVQTQIDRALLAGLGSFSIVHGKGEGILQKGIHEYLRSARGVTEYHFSRPEEGGFGRTEVTLAP